MSCCKKPFSCIINEENKKGIHQLSERHISSASSDQTAVCGYDVVTDNLELSTELTESRLFEF